MTRLALIEGQAARMINLFLDVRKMDEDDFTLFIKGLQHGRIREVIMHEIRGEDE